MRLLVERSTILSPLLNLAPAPPTGATLKHVRPLVPVRNSRITGTATLVLSPDRRTVDVSVKLDEARAAIIRLRRLKGAHSPRQNGSGENPLILEVLACEWLKRSDCIARRFSLDRSSQWGAFAEAGELLKGGIALSALTADSIEGIHVEPAREAAPGDGAPEAYLADRMLAELAAAECSATAVATARHVELAILYARRIRSGTLDPRCR